MNFTRAFALIVSGNLFFGCGYQAVYVRTAGERFHVHLVRSVVSEAIATDELVAGVRDELAKAGALLPGDGYPRVEVEVLRMDEQSVGIVESAAGAPLARGLQFRVLARAWVLREKGGTLERDTGDVGAAETIATDVRANALDPTAAALHRTEALRGAARGTGTRLGRRLLGLPAVSESL